MRCAEEGLRGLKVDGEGFWHLRVKLKSLGFSDVGSRAFLKILTGVETGFQRTLFAEPSLTQQQKPVFCLLVTVLGLLFRVVRL